MEAFDFLLGEEFDLAIDADGDFVFGESTLEHQRDLLLAPKGSFRQEPTIGVGLRTMLLDNAANEDIRRIIQEQLELDGMHVSTLEVNSLENIAIDARYA